MNSNRALSILNELIGELKDLPLNKEVAFKTKTEEFLRSFLGPDSGLYNKVKEFEIRTQVHNQMNDNEVSRAIKSHRAKLGHLLSSCIQVIQSNGIYKPKKENILSGKNNWTLLTISIGLILFGITLGNWIRDYEILSKFKTEVANEKLSNETEGNPNPISDTKNKTENLEEKRLPE